MPPDQAAPGPPQREGGVSDDEPDEHVRYRQFLEWVASADQADARPYLALLADPDRTMATSVVLVQLDGAGRRGCSPDWAPLVRTLRAAGWDDEPLVATRIAEWTTLAALLEGRTPHGDAVAATDRVQRALTEADGVPRAVLEALADAGRTKRVRRAATRRLDAREPLGPRATSRRG